MNDTATRNDIIRRMRREGHTFTEIALLYGLTRARIQQICADLAPVIDERAATSALRRAQKAGADIEVARAKMSELAAVRADAIRDALAAGMSQADVARQLGLSTSAVFSVLTRH